MTQPIGVRPPAGADDATRLRHAAKQLEGVFVQEMFKAMRQTVPESGPFGGGAGEEMFTAMLDGEIAALAPAKWERGLADALYRQLASAAGIVAGPNDGPNQGDTEP